VRTWPEGVQRVAAVLREAGVEARVEEFGEGTPTAADAAAAVGCRLGQIVKSLVFACDGGWVVALIPGDRRADRAKVAAEAGCARVATAGPTEVCAATGFDVGGVAPFPLPLAHVVLVDRTLLPHDVVWAGAGSPAHMVALAPVDLVRLSRARVGDLVSQNSG
jgi:prolyl-tRNA editing enzyme YbaK/EbsC (Cys-tRNA(Pro) deacylase)